MLRRATLLVLGMVLCACGQTNTLQVNEDQEGRSLVMTTGQTLVVSLESNPSTGFGWYQAEPTEPVLAMEGEPRFVPGEGAELAGAPGRQELHFVAGRKGVVTLKLTYGRAWETPTPSNKHYLLQVTVE
ncbi:protease inhibitor I42 family protein [Ferrimonas balearica]|uniref:protease inhibitor I42 family protein n=1 Tax=Ferrimonas balearica TaxID=44012 RepID=UPI001C995B57|nr:protease inhibitor I42 family protein [Ferrimonas balearica]MBY5921078.1 protease inhibitor I42 family protein [Ferrimonas balearica]MBY5996237.1 protease inhibitor I42 family protein [Ferrimonas balearica]